MRSTSPDDRSRICHSVPVLHLCGLWHSFYINVFAVTILQEKYKEKYKEKQNDLHMIFVDPENVYDGVPRDLI